MAKGIIYVMTCSIDGLIKLGKTTNFEQRMSNLENNGYRNASGLKRHFAIEVENYAEKEALLDSLLSRSRVSNAELFSVNVNEMVQLLTSFEGKIVYPPQEKKEEIFEHATEAVESLCIPDGTYTLDVNSRRTNVHAKATMSIKDRKITVLKGATVNPLGKLSAANWQQKRNSLHIINNITQEDFEASSPSMASSVVLGHNSNGWMKWKTSNGQYIDIFRKKAGDSNEED